MHGLTKREYQITNEAEIRQILDTATVLHLGLAVEGEPYVVPMNYGFTLEEVSQQSSSSTPEHLK